MWLSTIRNSAMRSPKGSRQRRTLPSGPQASKVRLQLETLEDRMVPSGGLIGNLVIFGDSLSDTANPHPHHEQSRGTVKERLT